MCELWDDFLWQHACEHALYVVRKDLVFYLCKVQFFLVRLWRRHWTLYQPLPHFVGVVHVPCPKV